MVALRPMDVTHQTLSHTQMKAWINGFSGVVIKAPSSCLPNNLSKLYYHVVCRPEASIYQSLQRSPVSLRCMSSNIYLKASDQEQTKQQGLFKVSLSFKETLQKYRHQCYSSFFGGYENIVVVVLKF